jgi:predicted glutamine amidotransferase
MCRWLAYRGRTIPLESYVTLPHHSLVQQSIAAKEGLAATNGDGFGLGWYGANEEPGLYREVRPAWSDENLRHLCRHITAHLFFAHVRASTGTPTTRPNCHPFAHGRFLFMHNGQLGDWTMIRRQVEALIPDAYYRTRVGTTDSEAAFLAIMGAGAEQDAVGALTRTVETLTAIVRSSASDQPFRFTIALADGETLYALRYAYPREAAHTLYYQDDGRNAVIASEPLDAERSVWRPAPVNSLLIARKDAAVEVRPFLEQEALAAE